MRTVWSLWGYKTRTEGLGRLAAFRYLEGFPMEERVDFVSKDRISLYLEIILDISL